MKVKRIFSFLAASILVMTLLPVSALAEMPFDQYEKTYQVDDPSSPLEESIDGFTTGINGVLLNVSNGARGKVTVTSQLKADGIGITASAADGTEETPAQATVVMNTVEAGGTGVEAIADGKNAEGINTLAYVTGGMISSTGDNSYGAVITGNNGGKAQVDTDDINAPAGVRLTSDGNGAAVLTAAVINSFLTADEDDHVNSFISSNLSSVQAEIESVNSFVNGINASASSKGWVTLNVLDTVKADKIGLNLANNEGVLYANIGTVESGDDGIRYSSSGSDPEAMIIFENGIESDAGNAIAYNSGAGKAFLMISQSAVSKSDDIETAGLIYSGTGNGPDSILVVDTLSGCNGVLLTGASEKLDLTVWKIEANGGEIIAGDDVDAFAKTVSYIVNLEQPSEGGTIYATKADGSPLDRKYNDPGESLPVDEEGFEVSHEDEKVLLKADLEPGYEIKAAYNGKGEKVELSVDADGNYYVIVPRGGGIYLSAELGKIDYTITTEAEHGSIEAPETAQSGEQVTVNTIPDEGYELAKLTYAPEGGEETDITETGAFEMPEGNVVVKALFQPKTFTLTFDLGGGTLNGKTGTYTMDCEYGSTIKLPGAPTKQGYKFLYWKGSRYEAGASYTVKGAHTFTAEWEAENPSPKTGDNNNAGLWAAIMGGSLLLVVLAVIAGRKYLKKQR